MAKTKKKNNISKRINDEVIIKTTRKTIYVNNLILSGVLLVVFYLILRYAELTMNSEQHFAALATFRAIPFVLIVSILCSYFTSTRN